MYRLLLKLKTTHPILDLIKTSVNILLSSHRLALWLLLLAGSFNGLYSQNQPFIDSLLIELRRTQSDSSRIQNLISLGWAYRHEQLDSFTHYSQRAHELAQEVGWTQLSVDAKGNWALSRFYAGEPQLAIAVFDSLISYCRETSYSAGEMRLLNNLGIVYNQIDEYVEANRIFRELLLIANEQEAAGQRAAAAVNLGMIQISLADWEQGITDNLEAMRVCTELEDTIGLALAYNNLSICYREDGQPDESLASIRQSDRLARSIGFTEQVNRGYSNFAATFLALGEIDSAYTYAKNGIAVSDAEQYPYNYVKLCWRMGQALLAKNQLGEAKKYADRAIEIARQIDSPDDLKFNYELLLDIAKAERNSEEVARLADSVIHWNEIIKAAAFDREMASANARYDTELLKRDLAVSQADLAFFKSRQKWLITLFVAGLSIIALIGMLFYYRQTKKRQKLALEAEQKYSQRMVDALDTYRQEVSATLHDDLGQNLLLIRQQSDPSNHVPENKELINDTIDRIRELASIHYPYQLEYVGLVAALEDLITQVKKKLQLNVNASINVEREPALNQSLHIYRIVQELLNNSHKHGQVKQIELRLAGSTNEIELIYLEDGLPFDFQSALNNEKTLGLKMMAHRARILGSELDFTIDEQQLKVFSLTFSIQADQHG
ncbi:MAG: tetratricopeptide repeat protein [Bacteroidota bacterium]